MIPVVDLKKQYQTIQKEIDAAVRKVFDDSWFILGKQGEEFEKEFAQYIGVKYAVGVGSGTEALHLSLIALGVGTGDEVITAPNTAVFTVSAITFANAKPVFVDINKEDYTLDVARLEKAITRKTKAIIPVHLYGQCANMAAILKVARKHKLAVIEDACQAHGAEFKGKKAGSMGDVGCFSFYPSKNLGTYGDGGMVVSNSAKIADKLRLLRNGGQLKRYYHKIKGFNSRLDEIQAAILRVKLKHLDEWNEQRRKKACLYDKLIKNEKIVKPIAAEHNKHVYHLYVVRTKERDRLREYLGKNNIQSQIHYPIPVHLQEAYKDLEIGEGKYPVAEEYARSILSLPMYPELKDEAVHYIADVLNKFK